MKLNKLLQARKVLSEHANEPIPTMLAYKILKFMKASDTEGAFYDQQLKEIIGKYAKKNDKGEAQYVDGHICILPDKIEECQTAINNLGDSDVDAPKITFSIQELTPINFSVSELYSLDEIIIEEG